MNTGFWPPSFGYGTLSLMCLILPHCFGQDITLTPQSPATVREGQSLVLTCQSGQTSGVYRFFYTNSEGDKISYATGGGGFKSCLNSTNDAFLECDFGTPWEFKLTLLNPVHNQTVYCQRSFQGRDANISSTIFVQVPVSSITLSPSSSVEVIEGTSFTFSCVSKAARPAANITWYKDGVVVSESSSSTSTNNLLYDVTSNLTSSYQRTDNGRRLHCTAVNINGDTPKQSSQAQLNVIYAPPTVPQLTADGSTSVDEGQSITLRCTLSTLGNPHITWSWVCGDDTLTTGVTNTGTKSVLTLTGNRKYNQRTCQCRATSPRPSLSYNRTSGTQTITVYYTPPAAPQLTSDGSTSVDEGRSITLRCNLSTMGNPHIMWSWMCGDDTLTTGVTNTGTQSELTLTANRKYTQRTCQCRATSPRSSLSYNRTSGTQTITVYYTPPAAPQLISVGSTSVDEGQSITLRCILSTLGNPHITWSWVCGDDTLTTGVTNTGTQSVLTLTANRKYNQRICQCRATFPRPSLSYNRTSPTKTITVYYNVITSNLSAEYVTSEHGRLQIKCDVDGNPLSTITWLFVQNNTVVKRDSSVSSSVLDISSANCLDHGSYSVTADNGKGPAAVRTTHVAVRCKPRLYNMDSQTPDKLGIGNNESLQILVRMLLYPQATLTQWTFLGKYNGSKVIQNDANGYSITYSKDENKQNISLYKRSVKTEDFGEYTLMVLNDVGTFIRIYYVDAARPPLKPTNLTLECGTSVKLSWISNFNGGDSQTFKISYSTVGVGDSSYKDLDTISDQGYGILHSYTPNIELQGTAWFTVTASNLFGNSTSDYVHCIVKGMQEEVSRQTETIVGTVVSSVALIIAVSVLAIFLRRRYKCTCIIKVERIDESIKAADLSKDESQINLAEQNMQGERIVYEELKERETGNQYQDLSTKGNQEIKTQTYESMQGPSADNKYEELSTVSKTLDQRGQTYYNSQTVTPTDVYVNTSFQN